MKKIVMFLLISCTTSSVAQNAVGFNSLLDSELMFARTASERGIRDAFLTFVAEDGIIFRPRPVNGKKWLLEHSGSNGILTWYPSFGEISLAGDLGFTTGPWEFRSDKDANVTAQGHFVTVWKRQDNDSWKFTLDIGITHLPSIMMEDTLRARLSVSSEPFVEIDQTKERENILSRDIEFSRLSSTVGLVKASVEYFVIDSRVLRINDYPIIGKDSILAFFSATRDTVQWEPTDGQVSSSDDLAYTYGIYRKSRPSLSEERGEEGNYLRIWKKSRREWNIVLDLFQPFEPQN